MEIPAMAVNGIAPVLHPLLVVFIFLSLAGAVLLLAALLRRNLLLVTQKGLNPFSLGDAQRAADPTFSTRPAGAPPFHRTLYGRVALGLLTVGVTGIIVMLLVELFGG